MHNSKLRDDDNIYRHAMLSDCKRYRYTLTRVFDLKLKTKKQLLICMLNPSTADANIDDPTIRKCIGFAKHRGHKGFVVVNLFGFRATDPKQLSDAVDPIGVDNDIAISLRIHIMLLDRSVDDIEVLCAWGTEGPQIRVDKIMRIFNSIGLKTFCLGKTKDGHPRHPLYVPYSQEFEEFQ